MVREAPSDKYCTNSRIYIKEGIIMNKQEIAQSKLLKQQHQRLYRIWIDMRQRCNNPNNKRYHKYGGRGINYCQEWTSWLNFTEWALENGYDDTLTIDRINNNDGYYPNNCRWATQKQQANNRSTSHYITIDDVTKTVSEWAEHFNINKSTIFTRIAKGWTEEDLFLPVK